MMTQTAQPVGTFSKEVGWYHPTLFEVPEETRQLLEEYSDVPTDQVIPHILRYRDLLWDVFPYPTIGQFRFVALSFYSQRSYASIVELLKKGGRYLDIGCAVGQDLRRLVLDGCPSTNFYAVEIAGGYVDLSYGLFADKETLAARFIKADFRDETVESTQALLGTVDVCHVGMVLHIWDLEDQIKACVRLTDFLNKKKDLEQSLGDYMPRGPFIVGTSAGRTVASVANEGIGGKQNYLHDVESFKVMWKEVGKRTGLKFQTNVWTHSRFGLDGEKAHWNDPGRRILVWEVTRV
ncbi:hypothetical protein BD289DRAFT_389105 [Coniella lustricola]|uniref:Methyltransferase domain-containing protein n=1 Tax=Coniella lustricola TaxID=2025994 RepID=A0A2T3A8X3_9PEZI|nr:hypothetical protein BD289DRAFT_389105 [Coniella lustricola]